MHKEPWNQPATCALCAGRRAPGPAGASSPVKLLDILQGKWLGHPLHPAIVHVPVGLWTAAVVFDLIAWFGPGVEALPRLAFSAVLVGLVAALLAVPTGAADWAPIKKDKPAWKLGLYHLLLNFGATIVWAVNFGLRLDGIGESGGVTVPILVTSLIGTALVFAGGYLGSLMVFDQGTAVARQSKKKWREIAERGGARLSEKSPAQSAVAAPPPPPIPRDSGPPGSGESP